MSSFWIQLKWESDTKWYISLVSALVRKEEDQEATAAADIQLLYLDSGIQGLS